MKVVPQRRFALLLATKDSYYVKEAFQGYINVFVQAFGDEGEIWDLYRVVEGEFPDDLQSYDGFVISGSQSDAYGTESWILRLRVLVHTLHAMHKRVLGICFGHQVLCHALGGRVARARGGWDLGTRKVIFNERLRQRWFLDGAKEIPPCASIIECHQDEVWEVPPGGEAMAFSEKTNVEMFCMEDHILGIQGHPEYTEDIFYDIIDRLAQKGCIDVSTYQRGLLGDARARVKEVQPDREFWKKMCKSFLKG